MPLDAIHALIAEDLSETDRLIQTQLRSEVELIQQIGEYVFQSGGKRARAALTLLASKVCGLAPHSAHLLAAIIEMIHTATLLHDDVVDASEMRRGQASANHKYGNAASVLSGDFLYSRTFQMMIELKELRVLDALASTSNKIAEGEMLQLQNCHQTQVTEQQYLKVIESKTAALFEAAASIPALMTHVPLTHYEALARFGCCVGIAFQLLDDLIDYTSDAVKMGKNPGDDLAEGKMTLPLIYAKEALPSDDQTLINDAILHGDMTALPAILKLIQRTQSVERVKAKARGFIEEAKAGLAVFTRNAYVDALCQFADAAIERSA